MNLFKNKRNHVSPISIDKVWEKTSLQYQKSRDQYMREWQFKKNILIVGYIFFIVPGLIFHLFVWLPGLIKRKQIAIDVFQTTLNKIIAEEKKSKIKNLNFLINNLRQSKSVNLLFSKANTILRKIPRLPSFCKKKSYKSQSVYSHNMYEIVQKFGILNQISRDKTLSTGITVSHKAFFETNSNFYCEIKGHQITGGNLQIIFERIVVAKRNGYQRSIAFSGLIFYLPNTILPYSAALLTKQKKEFGGIGNAFQNSVYWKKLQFPLSAAPFNDKFQVLVSEEKGSELRKTFNPRHMTKMIDATSSILPYTFVFIPDTGFALIVKSFSNGDLPLSIDKVSHFFKDEESAKKIIEKELSPFFMGLSLIKNWDKQGFFVKADKLTTK